MRRVQPKDVPSAIEDEEKGPNASETDRYPGQLRATALGTPAAIPRRARRADPDGRALRRDATDRRASRAPPWTAPPGLRAMAWERRCRSVENEAKRLRALLALRSGEVARLRGVLARRTT